MTALAACLTACGGSSPFVVDASLRTFQQNDDLYLETSAIFNTGGLNLPSFEIPIPNPTNLSKPYGRVSLYPGFHKKAELILGFNLSSLTGLSWVAPRLPNGSHLPIGGLVENEVFTIPISGTSARAYVSSTPGRSLLGIAIPIREFMPIGGIAGNAGVFSVFRSASWQGIAGVFTGSKPEGSGIAFFIDATTAFSQLRSPNGLLRTNSLRAELIGPPLMFNDSMPQASQHKKILKQLKKLSDKKTRLHTY